MLFVYVVPIGGNEPSQKTYATFVLKQGKMVNLREAFLLGENPNDPGDVFQMSEVGIQGAAIQFRFTTLPNRRYYLEQSDTLETWVPVPGWEESLTGQGQEYNPSLPLDADRRFYRVRITFL